MIRGGTFGEQQQAEQSPGQSMAPQSVGMLLRFC